MFYKMTLTITMLFVISFAAGWWLLQVSWQGKSHINVAQVQRLDRDPAAINQVFDFSTLRGTALSEALKKRLLQGAEFLRKDQRLGIKLGHFVVSGPNGRRIFACARYDKIVVIFRAQGMAVNGKRPQMRVVSDCRISKNVNETATIWVPVDRVRNEKPTEMRLDYMLDLPVSLTFKNLFGSWPKSWELVSIELYNSGEGQGQGIKVTTSDIQKIHDGAISINW